MTTIKPVRRAVIPAAGLGTRFLPATKATPKEMLPIVDKPTIQYIIEEALASGIEDIIIISGKSKRAISRLFSILSKKHLLPALKILLSSAARANAPLRTILTAIWNWK